HSAYFLLHSPSPYLDLHSFPTRRSSDLREDRQCERRLRHSLVREHARLQGLGAGRAAEGHGVSLPAAHPGDLDGGRVVIHRALRSEEHTSELQSRSDLVCRLLLEKKKQK